MVKKSAKSKNSKNTKIDEEQKPFDDSGEVEDIKKIEASNKLNKHKELTNVYNDLGIKLDNNKSNRVVYYDKNNLLEEDETQVISNDNIIYTFKYHSE